jgi:CRISPR/Cas system-associated exonuclease Cas4 (RecB family)
MEYFLERIARSIYGEFGNTLNRHCLVFPSRRAGLYFLKYLSSRIDKPVWTPSIMSVNELFRTFSDLKQAENELLLFELYEIYSNLKKNPESFDDFFFWGDMLLNDFDDIDKYLVDPDSLFTNVRDIKKIDELFGDLSQEQKDVIRQFWINFDRDKQSGQKDGFIGTWEILPLLYRDYKAALREKDLGYEGMIFREVVGKLADNSEIKIKWDIVHFIGFNALNQCEKKLMLRLKKEGRARFYWDYDNSYVLPGRLNSAGFFMKDNLKIFGNSMPDDWSYDTYLSKSDKKIRRRVIDVTSDVAQVKLLPSLIGDLGKLPEDKACHTAIILADENLLLPVLTSIPGETGDVNITMGFPLHQTSVFFIVTDLLNLQKNSVSRDSHIFFRREDARCILENSYIKSILAGKNEEIKSELPSGSPWISISDAHTETIKNIFSRPETPLLLSGYFRSILSEMAIYNREDKPVRNLTNEFIYRMTLCINRLETIISSSKVNFSNETWIRLLEKLLRLQTVPFSGEPLSGIQIMGMLETRALDFDNIIILSVNEGVLPSGSSVSSFIPFSLREAYGLPSINHQESIYAYHFYRLLQRAENVTFVYNSNSTGLRSGEMSRFLLQMKYTPGLCPEFTDLNFAIRTASDISDTVVRTPAHSRLLRSRFENKMLSPSAINTWLGCRMKFYFQYINGLYEPDEPVTEIDPAALGSMLHDMMSGFYLRFKGKEVPREYILSIPEGSREMSAMIENAINQQFNREPGFIPEGKEIIVREVLAEYLKRVLKADLACTPFRILHLEEKFSFTVDTGNGVKIAAGGKIDRIDLKDGKIRIVDYKTGTISDTIPSVQSLFEDDRKKDHDAWLQILLYCEAFISVNSNHPVYPLIYRIKKADTGKLNGYLLIKDGSETIVDDYRELRHEFLSGLNEVVRKIFSDDENFTMTKISWGKCPYCPFRSLCLR